jgi:K+-transporting ATPase KdpF subunit
MRVASAIVAQMLYRKCHPRARETIAIIKRTREVSMMDLLMIAIALGLFALAIAYAHVIGERWGGWTMVFDYSLAALVAIGLLAYLVFALLHPELF